MGDECEGCSCCGEEMSLDELGSEAKEVAALFEEVDNHLVNAFKSRKKLIEAMHKHVNESPHLKGEVEKVIKTRNRDLVSFVLGD